MISMPLTEFESAIPGSEQPQNYALERATTEIGLCYFLPSNIYVHGVEYLSRYSFGHGDDGQGSSNLDSSKRLFFLSKRLDWL
jgi:hypothetical protein